MEKLLKDGWKIDDLSYDKDTGEFHINIDKKREGGNVVVSVTGSNLEELNKTVAKEAVAAEKRTPKNTASLTIKRGEKQQRLSITQEYPPGLEPKSLWEKIKAWFT